MSCIGKNIRKIRTIKGLSQTDFANLFDLTRASISAYEENRAEPKMDTTLKIAKYFNIPIEELLTHEITVNEFARFNLQNFIADESKFETISIPIVASRNWESFLNNEKLANFPSFNCPKNFIQGDIAIEVNENVNTTLHTGTLLLCSKHDTFTESGVYLTIDKKVAAIQNGHQIKKTKGMQFYKVFQKIEEMNSLATVSVEERLSTLEQQVKKLLKK